MDQVAEEAEDTSGEEVVDLYIPIVAEEVEVALLGWLLGLAN